MSHSGTPGPGPGPGPGPQPQIPTKHILWNVAVPAKYGKQFTVKAGQKYYITASDGDLWSWDSGHNSVGPAGFPPEHPQGLLAQGAVFASLIGTVNGTDLSTPPWNFQTLKPMFDALTYAIGSTPNFEITPTVDGFLYLAMNDTGNSQDNTGSCQVEISIMS